MRRLGLIGSWRRLGLQAGLLSGLGLAFVGSQEKPAGAGGLMCTEEGQCTFKKPNFLIVLDYSSSMNEDFGGGQTRWEAAIEAIQNLVTTNGGFFDQSMHMALLRFGHDPVPLLPNTTIPGDTSGIVDGVSLDVPWYDPVTDPDGYFECNGPEISTFLDLVPPPLCNFPGCSGIGTWTNGGMLEAQAIIQQSRIDHPDDLDVGDERFYSVLLITDGVWHDVDGLGPAATPPSQNPALTAGDLWTNDGVPTYVVAFGDAAGDAFADEVAFAGGTMEAIDAGTGELVQALEDVVTDIANQVIIPECTAGLPRMMMILDASSSMLNVGGVAGAMGTTGWDQARDALAGMNSLFDLPVASANNRPVEDLVHLGLTVFGAVGEEQVLVDYGPCMQDNFDWALDPETSCAGGCADPWGGPPITWTFVGPGDAAYPGFDQDTYSHMPQCGMGPLPGPCNGSGTYTHLGLAEADANYHAYITAPPAIYPIDAGTVFANILITDGSYATYSTDAQVESELAHLYGADGITTYVIGFGDNIAVTQLANMACWGSGGAGLPCGGGTESHYEATTQDDLEMALQSILDGIMFDPCCAFNDCSENPEPTTGEPDRGEMSASASASAGSGDTGDTDSASGTMGSASATDSMGTDSMGSASASATMGSASATDSMGTDSMGSASATDSMGTDSMGTDSMGSASATDSMGSDSMGTDSMGSASASDSGATDSMGSASGSDSGDASASATRGDSDSSGGVVDSGVDSSGDGGVDDTNGDSGSASNSGPMSGSASASGSGASASASGATVTASAGGGQDTGDTDAAGASGGTELDDGCSCRADAPTDRTWLGSLLLLTLGGLTRRRRRG